MAGVSAESAPAACAGAFVQVEIEGQRAGWYHLTNQRPGETTEGRVEMGATVTATNVPPNIGFGRRLLGKRPEQEFTVVFGKDDRGKEVRVPARVLRVVSL